MSRRRSAPSLNSTPALEQRVLLAGMSLSAVSPPTGSLTLSSQGIAPSNSIEIVQNSTDVYTVRGPEQYPDQWRYGDEHSCSSLTTSTIFEFR